MGIWKTLRVSHIPTPPATTANYGLTKRYTNIPLGTKDRSDHDDIAANTKAKLPTHRNIKSAREVLYGKVISAIGEPITSQMDAVKAVQFLKDYKMTVTHD